MKKLFFIFLIVLLFKPLWLFNDLKFGHQDDFAYWLHSYTFIFDYDLNYSDDYEFNNNTSSIYLKDTNAPYHSPGSAFISSFIVKIFSIFSQEDIYKSRLNPFGTLVYLGYFFASLFYTFLAYLLLNKLLENKGLFSYKRSILLMSFIGTLVHYVFTRFLMPHAVEFFLCVSIIYIFENYEKVIDNKLKILIFLYFLLLISRPSTFVIYLLFLVLYRKKIVYKILDFILVTLFGFIFVEINQAVYSNNFGFFNIMLEYVTLDSESLISFSTLISKIKYIFPLFLSPSMGIIWVIPIVAFGFISFLFQIKNFNFDFFVKLSIYLAFFALTIIWEGREVAFGQRLLIGLIPISVLDTSNYFSNKTNKKNQIIFNVINSVTYIGYFFFYSSNSLTLREGVNLYGKKINLAAENYFIILFREIFDFEIIFSALSRNIFIVNFLKFFEVEYFLDKFQNIYKFDEAKLIEIVILSNHYKTIDASYIFLADILLFVIVFLIVKIIFSKRSIK